MYTIYLYTMTKSGATFPVGCHSHYTDRQPAEEMHEYLNSLSPDGQYYDLYLNDSVDKCDWCGIQSEVIFWNKR